MKNCLLSTFYFLFSLYSLFDVKKKTTLRINALLAILSSFFFAFFLSKILSWSIFDDHLFIFRFVRISYICSNWLFDNERCCKTNNPDKIDSGKWRKRLPDNINCCKLYIFLYKEFHKWNWRNFQRIKFNDIWNSSLYHHHYHYHHY